MVYRPGDNRSLSLRPLAQRMHKTSFFGRPRAGYNVLLHTATDTQTCQRWLHVRNFRIICARLRIMPRRFFVPFTRHTAQLFSMTKSPNFNEIEPRHFQKLIYWSYKLVFSNARGYLAVTSIGKKLGDGWRGMFCSVLQIRISLDWI